MKKEQIKPTDYKYASHFHRSENKVLGDSTILTINKGVSFNAQSFIDEKPRIMSMSSI
jgi:hypothetical protein